MPYPNEHACRLRDPGDFEEDSFRRTEREHEGRSYSVIMGRLEGEEELTEQAYRYPKDGWTAADARAHCEAHDGQEFSPASEEDAQPDDMERRVFSGPMEIREGADGEPEIVGYAAVFDQWSQDLGGFIERIEPGFFAPVLESDVRGLWQHDPSHVLGRTTNGTLALAEDDNGLQVRIRPPDSQWARDALVSMRRGDVNQMSFGFEVAEDRWERASEETGGIARRTLIRAARLYDVSPVTFPAYPQTSVSVRQHLAGLQARAAEGADDEDALRERRLQAREARRLRIAIRQKLEV
jgi:HK97 family phage prohead protease